jgi:uncharacterized membrane protein SpoIIM required for sporulation
MLESLIRFSEIEERPWLLFLWALLISSVGVLFSVQLSYVIRVSGTSLNLTGLFSVLFTIIPSVYFLTMYIKRQESMDERDIEHHYSKAFWVRHDKDILAFLFLFFGLTLSYAFWAYILPPDTFQIQTMKVQDIRAMAGSLFGPGSATGEFMNAFAAGDEYGSFTRVFLNNMQVTGFAFIFSVLFGAGAVFIVVWNASILGVYIGRLSETVAHIPLSTLPFLPHGIPEIGGYLIAGLAGGLLSAAIIRGHKKEILVGIFRDVLKLLALAVLFVFLGALIETMDFTVRVVSIFVFYSLFIYIITVALTPVKYGLRRRR